MIDEMKSGFWQCNNLDNIIREQFRHTEVMYIEAWKLTIDNLEYLAQHFEIQAIVDSTTNYVHNEVKL